jgi:hypothetical protein
MADAFYLGQIDFLLLEYGKAQTRPCRGGRSIVTRAARQHFLGVYLGRRPRWTAIGLVVLASCLSVTETSSEEIASDRPAIQIPSNLQIVGRITGAQLAIGAPILVQTATDEAVVGQGSMIDEKGTFFVEMSQDSSFNGTELHLAVVVAGQVEPLIENGQPATFLYVGGFPFPTRLVREVTLTKNLIGEPNGRSMRLKVACPNNLPKCDVNGDGHFDRRDAMAIQVGLSTEVEDRSADVNGDGIVNTRDLVLVKHYLDAGF